MPKECYHCKHYWHTVQTNLFSIWS